LNRSVKLLRDIGELEVNEYRTPDRVKEFVEESQYIRRRSWQGEAFGVKGMSSESYIREHELLAQNGLFRSFVLKMKEEPVAFIRGYQYRSRFFYEEIGFDPKWSAYSPGTVLNWLMMPLLYETTCPSRIEFGLGNAQYKKVFGNSVSKASRGVYAPPASYISYLSTVQLLILRSEELIRKLLEFVRLDARIRRLLRHSNMHR
jgi:hypothetical protein